MKNKFNIESEQLEAIMKIREGHQLFSVSIVIPVFNVEKYLNRCLESILQQDYTDFEIILVDDGSKDNSGKICDEYEVLYPDKITVIHKKNGGVSSARNIGIDIANGKWIYFCDADDELLPDALSSLINCAKNVDLVAANFISVYNGKEISNPIYSDINLTKREALKILFTGLNGIYQGYLWTKLFKSAIIKKYQLKFNESIYYNEDRLFIFQYLNRSKGFCYCTSIPIYKYNIRNNSAMQSINGSKYKLFQTDTGAFIKMLTEARNIKETALVNIIQSYSCSSYLKNIKLIKNYGTKSELLEFKNKYKHFLPFYKRLKVSMKMKFIQVKKLKFSILYK